MKHVKDTRLQDLAKYNFLFNFILYLNSLDIEISPYSLEEDNITRLRDAMHEFIKNHLKENRGFTWNKKVHQYYEKHIEIFGAIF